jgi:glycosyltransferase involved in cell wall biosynthesis
MHKKVKQNKTILLINDQFDYKGGADNFFYYEKQVYESAGFKVITFSHETLEKKHISNNDFVHQENKSIIVRKIGKFIFNPSAYWQLRKLLRKYNPFFVKLHLITKYPSTIYSALRGYNVLQTLHGPNLFCATGWGCLKNSDECDCGIGYKCYKRGCVPFYELPLHILAYRINRYLSRSIVKAFVSPTKHLMCTARNLGFQNVRLAPLCVDEEFMKAPTHQRSNSDPRILYVGTLSRQKGIHILLKAFAIILRNIPNAKLILVGRNQERYLEEARSLSILHRTEFVGFIDHKKIITQYRTADVFAMPSIWKEQFGVVGIEALACGLPCVGTNIGGIPEWLIDGKNGFLVPPGDAEALAAKIILLLRDQELQRKFACQGRDFVIKHFSPDQFKRNTMALLEEFSCTDHRRGPTFSYRVS